MVGLAGFGCGEPDDDNEQSPDAAHDQHDAGASDDSGGSDFSEFAGGRETATVDGSFYVRYTPTPDPIPVSELFTVEVEVYESSEMSSPVSGADLSIAAEMPTHGHGMNTEPQVTANGDGTYTIEGMKFHMPSDPQNPWTIDLTIDKDGTSDVAKFKVITGEK
jgi:hypothetical protein